jgi:LysM repeat protein
MIGAAMEVRGARFLAPIALAAVAVATYLIVHHGLAQPHAAVGHSSPASALPVVGRHGYRTAKFYVVKSGDTLSGISVKTHVPILRLQSLNPGTSPTSLQTGQRLRLRR